MEASKANEKLSVSEVKPRFEEQQIKPTYWLFVARSDGSIEVYSLPDYRMVYLIENLPIGDAVLIDDTKNKSIKYVIVTLSIISDL